MEISLGIDVGIMTHHGPFTTYVGPFPKSFVTYSVELTVTDSVTDSKCTK